MLNLEEKYKELCNTPSDINEHLPKLREIGEKVSHITEFGVRGGVSTTSLLASNPKKLICYDMNPIPNSLYELAEQTDVDFRFIQTNVLHTYIEPTEFLFIDTLHTYEQLSQELYLHSSKVSKYIAFHDTELFGLRGENYEGKFVEGLRKAINEFLQVNPQWKQVYQTSINNGLTIIEKLD